MFQVSGHRTTVCLACEGVCGLYVLWKLREANRQLVQAFNQNEKLVNALYEAREQITALKEEVDKLCAPPSTYGVYLAANEDNTVTIRIANSEMGQGALTGLAMLVAEELECDWATVRTAFVRPEENLRRRELWGDLSTGASRSIGENCLVVIGPLPSIGCPSAGL